jgi:hypothetical protein
MSQARTSADNSGSEKQFTTPEEYRKLVQRVADKVWILWRAELRHERERRGSEVSKCRP